MLQTVLFIDKVHIIIHSKTAKVSPVAAFQLSGSNIFLWAKEQPYSHLSFIVGLLGFFYDEEHRRRAVINGDSFCETELLSTERLPVRKYS